MYMNDLEFVAGRLYLPVGKWDSIAAAAHGDFSRARRCANGSGRGTLLVNTDNDLATAAMPTRRVRKETPTVQ